MSTGGGGSSRRVAERRFAFLHRSGVGRHEADDRLAVQLLGDDRKRRRQAQIAHDADLVRRIGDEVAQEPEHPGCLVHRPGEQAGQHGRAEGMQLELERRDDAEVAATAA